MFNAFIQYVHTYNLFSPTDRLLIAVSGGIDSMVLCHLLHTAKYDFAIAHVNFQLRGEESDRDALFVRQYAEKLGCQYHEIAYDTEGVSRQQKMGIQETARQLRYQWFENLRQQFDYQWIVTAHHGSDSIETFLFNFTRGAGLRGLTGISNKLEFVVRPLLFATKNQIKKYAYDQQIEFVTDSSNQTDKYARNLIRQHVVPKLETINPSFEETAIHNLNYLRDYAALVEIFIAKIQLECVQKIGNQLFINRKELEKYPAHTTILFELVKNYGFNSTQIEQALACHNERNQIGNRFLSTTHEMRIERGVFVIKTLPTKTKQETLSLYPDSNAAFFLFDKTLILEEQNKEKAFFLSDETHLFFEEIQILPNSTMLLNKRVAYIDLENIQFPLIVRRWQEGDKFAPFGMKGKHQLLSDFFRLNKFSQEEKTNIWIMTDATERICWVVGHRISDAFKANHAKPVLKITWQH